MRREQMRRDMRGEGKRKKGKSKRVHLKQQITLHIRDACVNVFTYVRGDEIEMR